LGFRRLVSYKQSRLYPQPDERVTAVPQAFLFEMNASAELSARVFHAEKHYQRQKQFFSMVRS
jgi:hypothetical protein